MKIAVFPGSFDPVTLGHLSVIEAVAPIFDKLYVAIGVNADKPGCFPVEKRKQWLQQVLSSFNNIEIIDYNGLTVDLCKTLNAKFLVRGLRNVLDFQYEKDMAEANRKLHLVMATFPHDLGCPAVGASLFQGCGRVFPRSDPACGQAHCSGRRCDP